MARISKIISGDEWNRTTDTRIFSPLLYQLSYITLMRAQRYLFLHLYQKLLILKHINNL